MLDTVEERERKVKRVDKLLSDGLTLKDACRAVGRSTSWYRAAKGRKKRRGSV